MNKLACVFLVSVLSCSSIFAQQYNDYFTGKACRVDFHFCGNVHQTTVFLNDIKQEPFWGGRHSHLSQDLNLGDFRFRILDSISNKQIYMDGFSALYREWLTTPEATITGRSFEQTIQFPFPKEAITLIIEKRTDLDHWSEMFRHVLSPTDKLIQLTPPKKVPVKIIAKTAVPEKVKTAEFDEIFTYIAHINTEFISL